MNECWPSWTPLFASANHLEQDIYLDELYQNHPKFRPVWYIETHAFNNLRFKDSPHHFSQKRGNLANPRPLATLRHHTCPRTPSGDASWPTTSGGSRHRPLEAPPSDQRQDPTRLENPTLRAGKSLRDGGFNGKNIGKYGHIVANMGKSIINGGLVGKIMEANAELMLDYRDYRCTAILGIWRC